MATRQPAVAGLFYYQDRETLAEELERLFKNVKAKPENILVISPHAGYMYSGQTAAWAIASLKPAKTFIVLGPNHSGIGSEFSIMRRGRWKTPLGDVEIDGKIADELKRKCSFLEEDESAHENEHSIEVQLPFLQYRFGGFRVVPICLNHGMGSGFIEKCKKLGEEIAALAKIERLCVVASSDFSHYVPLEVADEVDGKVVETIKKLDVKQFFETIEKTNASVCGFGPIAIAMSAAKTLGLKAAIIHKSSSGYATGDFGSVVAYYAFGFG